MNIKIQKLNNMENKKEFESKLKNLAVISEILGIELIKNLVCQFMHDNKRTSISFNEFQKIYNKILASYN